MIAHGTGGANTLTGLAFEGKTDLATFLAGQPGYTVSGTNVLYEGEMVAQVFKKHEFYRYIEARGIRWQEHLSKRLIPDNCLYVICNNTLFIIECKFQQVAGSVDEKLQTCDYKLKTYRRLLASLNYEVQYVYLLNDWFLKPEYRDTLTYVINVGCHYYFNYIPLRKLGLPVPPTAGPKA